MSGFQWFDGRPGAAAPTGKAPVFVRRDHYQILRFELPALAPAEALQAVKFKLRAVYPAQTEVKYFVIWEKAKVGLLAFVLVFDEAHFAALTALVAQRPVYLSLPLVAPKAWGPDCLMYSHAGGSWQLNLYTGGSIHQSHVLKLSQDGFEKLLHKMSAEHPAHRVICVDSPDSWGHPVVKLEKLFADKLLPALPKTVAPKKTGLGTGGRVALTVLGLAALGGQLGYGTWQKQQELEGLKARLNDTARASLVASLQAKKQEVAELRQKAPLAVTELLSRLYAQVGTSVKWSALGWSGKKLVLEGQADQALAVLEGLRKDPWFAGLVLHLRVDPQTGRQLFQLEGEVKRD